MANAAYRAVVAGNPRELSRAKEIAEQLLDSGVKLETMCQTIPRGTTAWMRLPRADAAAALSGKSRAVLNELAHLLGFPLELDRLAALPMELLSNILCFLELDDIRNLASSSRSVAARADAFRKDFEKATKDAVAVGRIATDLSCLRNPVQAMVDVWIDMMLDTVEHAGYLKFIPVAAMGRSLTVFPCSPLPIFIAMLDAFITGVASLGVDKSLGSRHVQEGHEKGINEFLAVLDDLSDPWHPGENADLIEKAQVLGEFTNLRASRKVVAALDGRKALFELHGAIQGPRSGEERRGEEWARGIAQRIERIPKDVLSNTVRSVLERAVLNDGVPLSKPALVRFAALYQQSVAQAGPSA